MCNPVPELLLTKEVAAMFGVTNSTILRWAESGKLHPIRVQRTLRYRADDIQALMKEASR